MVAAFLDSWLTGDPETDEYISKAAGPSGAEVASVAGLAIRLHLGGAGTPRRYAWGQAIRRAVLAVLLVHAVLAVDVLVFLEWSHRLVGWLPAPPGSLVVAPAGDWITVYYLVNSAWIVIFVTLALGYYRTARILAALAIVPGLVALLQAQLTGIMPAPFAPWVCWVLLDPTPVLASPASSGRPRKYGTDSSHSGRNRSTCSAEIKPPSFTACWSPLADPRRCVSGFLRTPAPTSASGHEGPACGDRDHQALIAEQSQRRAHRGPS